MSNKLNILESKKLFKELSFLTCDADFKNEISKEYGKSFERDIRIMIDKEPMVVQACRDRFGSLLDNPTGDTQDSITNAVTNAATNSNKDFSESTSTDVIAFTGETTYEAVIKLDKGDPKLKSIYRKIVTITHPDKVKSNALNKFYVKATDANKNGDILTLYSICNELGIDFEITDDEVHAIRKRNQLIRVYHINFENGHLWQWVYARGEQRKREVIRHFLLHHAPSVKVLF